MSQSIYLFGNVGKDANIRILDNNVKVAVFTVACTKYIGKDDQEQAKKRTEWFTVQAWRSAAEEVEKNLRKGDRVAIHGEVRTRQYEKDGQKHFQTYVDVNFWEDIVIQPKQQAEQY